MSSPASAGILQSSGSVTVGTGGSLCGSSVFNNTLLQTTCGNGTTTGLSKAQTDYGILKAYSSYTSTNEATQEVSVLATAFFTDFLTLSSSAIPSSVDFTFTVTGSGFSGTGGSMLLSVSAPAATPLTVTSGAGSYTFTANWAPAYTPGDPFSLILNASLQAKAQFDNGAPGPWSGSGTADFFSTATLTAITVYDGSHVDISDTVDIIGGAASYPLSGGGGAVPEPSTILLTAGGAAAAFLIRKRSHA